MRYALMALAACGVAAATTAQAQYYGPPPPRYYGPPPGNYYDEPPQRYYGPPPGYYRGPPARLGEVPRAYDPAVRAYRGNPYQDPWRPRIDPRNGGLYCVQTGYTVQDGICKPGNMFGRW